MKHQPAGGVGEQGGSEVAPAPFNQHPRPLLCDHPPTHPLTLSLIHSLTHSLVHSPTMSLPHSPVMCEAFFLPGTRANLGHEEGMAQGPKTR